MPQKYFLTICLSFTGFLCFAQSTHSFSGYILDAQNKEALPFATIRLKSDSGKFHGATTDADGKFNIRGMESGTYLLTLSYIGYETQESNLAITGNLASNFFLTSSSTELNEVIVTASESRGITSASKIDRTAMEHLQPSSFADLPALLPGGTTSPPNMRRANVLRLREAGTGGSDYNTGSLGTRFVIDDTPVSTEANMQRVASDIGSFDGYSHVNSGVDMRTLSTDNIESVEIIRGIPSVRYNNLTSGVVIINRKQKSSPLTARIKADQGSKLFSAGKVFEWKEKGITLGTDIDYLNAQNDPRDRYNRYKRVNLSLRLAKKWLFNGGHALNWQSHADYSGNIDNVKNDPDIEKLTEDSYRSSYHSTKWNNKWEWKSPKGKAFRRLSANLSAGLSHDKIKRSRFVQQDRDRIAPTHLTAGEHDAEILPYTYMAHAEVDGKPVNLHARAEAEFVLQTGAAHHKVLAGTTFDYDKNLGNGQVYDPARPLNPTTAALRPRKYKDIPASERWQLYMEDNIHVAAGRHNLEIQAGIGGNMMLNLGKRYALHGKFYLDPRLNIQWRLPKIAIGKNWLEADLTAGMGWMTLMPTPLMMYPENIYIDLVRLNYWHSNPAYKRINLHTFIVSPVNHDLKAARNLKKEMRLGLKYRKNELTVTYFRERMNSGFRSFSAYTSYEYKVYDASGVAAATLTAPPSLSDLPYTVQHVLRGHAYTGNGSSTQKEGVEFQFVSERFSRLHTRFTVNGAWMRTIYENSEPIFKSVSAVVNGIALSDLYAGLYEVDDSYRLERFNTNFTADTYLKKAGLALSVTSECMWLQSRQRDRASGTPIAYMDANGKVAPYTEADKNDLYKQHLVISYAASVLDKDITPFYMYVNFKATKEFGKHFSLALFANRMLDCMPDYTRNGYLIRRTAGSPYFGMEMKLSL